MNRSVLFTIVFSVSMISNFAHANNLACGAVYEGKNVTSQGVTISKTTRNPTWLDHEFYELNNPEFKITIVYVDHKEERASSNREFPDTITVEVSRKQSFARTLVDVRADKNFRAGLIATLGGFSVNVNCALTDERIKQLADESSGSQVNQ